MQKKSWLVMLLAVSLLVAMMGFAVVGCSPADAPPAGEGKTEETGGETEEGAEEAGGEVSMPSILTIGASEPGSSWYPMAVAMKDVLEKKYEDMEVEIFYGGGDINLQALESGEIDFGITFGVTAYDAMEGRAKFEKPLENVRGAMGIFLAAMQLVTSPDSGIDSIADLKGKTISTGMPFYATTGMFPSVLKCYGLTEDDVTWEFATMPDIGVMFKDKSIDFFAVHNPITTPFPIIEDITSHTPIKMLSLSDEALEQLYEENPGHLKVTVPAGLYRGQDEEVTTQGAVALLATRADLPEEVVYEVVKTLTENSEELARYVSDLSYISAENGPEGLGVPLHSGAERYYKEEGTL